VEKSGKNSHFAHNSALVYGKLFMNDKLTISDFGLEQSQQFEETKQFAPQQFLVEAKDIYAKSNLPIEKGVFLSELDSLFETKISNRPFASFSFPKRIEESFLLLGPAQPMQRIKNTDTIQRVLERLDTIESSTETDQLKGAFNIVHNYLKDAQVLRNAIISIGKG
jgi:hypothetical protein